MNISIKSMTAVTMAAALATTMLTGCGKKDDVSSTTPIATPTVNTASDSESGSTDIGGNVIVSENAGTSSGALKLTKLEVAKPNNVDNNGYAEYKVMEDGKPVSETLYDELLSTLEEYVNENGAKINIFSGHRVYIKDRLLDPSEKEKIIESGTTDPFALKQKCILSGAEIFYLEDDTNEIVYPDTVSQLRTEKEGQRIYVYTTQESFDQAKKNRADGQAILNGEMEAPDHCIILNGSLVPDIKWETGEDGRTRISLRDVASAYDEHTEYDEFSGLLTIPLCMSRWEPLPNIDICDTPSAAEYYQVSSDRKSFVFTNHYGYDWWSDTFELPQDSRFMMPIEDISRILGWNFYTGDDVLSIVTDELDDTAEENMKLYLTVTEDITLDLDGTPAQE